MNLANLTEDQQQSIISVYNEFVKLNAPKQKVGLLIDINSLIQKDIETETERDRIKIKNKGFRKILSDVVKSDCAKLNSDLINLNLKATLNGHGITISDMDYVVTDKVDHKRCFEIGYGLDGNCKNIANEFEATGTKVSFWIDGNHQAHYKTIEELIPFAHGQIFQMYRRNKK